MIKKIIVAVLGVVVIGSGLMAEPSVNVGGHFLGGINPKRIVLKPKLLTCSLFVIIFLHFSF